MGAAMKAGRVKCRLAFVLMLAAGGASAAFDPTAPSGIQTEAGAASRDAGLAWVRLNGRDSLAWYGGTAVRLGDPVAGGRVTAIAEDHIVISGKGGRRTVYLLDRPIRGNRRH